MSLATLKKTARSARHKQVMTHGARYIEHRVLCDSKVKALRGTPSVSDEDLATIVFEAMSKQCQSVTDYILDNHEKEYLQVLFKNTVKVKGIQSGLLRIGTRLSTVEDLFST